MAFHVHVLTSVSDMLPLSSLLEILQKNETPGWTTGTLHFAVYAITACRAG
jgi:hypothetical protein